MRNVAKPVPAVVVGMEVNGLGVTRALAQARIPCIGLAGPYWSSSCYTRTAFVRRLSGWSAKQLIEDLISLGKELGRRVPLLITKDEPVLWVSEHRRDLADFFEINLPTPATVDLLMNKRLFHELACSERWPQPVSWKVSTEAELQNVIDQVQYPCILKPQVKNSAFREHGPRKAFKLGSPSALADTYRLVAQWEPEVMVQEWIGGGDDRIVFCLGYWDRNGHPKALFVGRKLRQWPVECGNTALCEPAPEAWRDQIRDLTVEIFRRVGYRGLGSIEYKMVPGTDQPVIMEPTVGRTNYQNEIAVINGVNLPLCAYEDLLHLDPLPRADQVRGPLKLIDAPAELKAAVTYIRCGQLTPASWLTSRRGTKKGMTFRIEDPLPGLMAAATTARQLGVAAIRHATRPLMKAVRLTSLVTLVGSFDCLGVVAL